MLPMLINLRVAALLCAALVAFAFNSVLTRLALGAGEMDAATFATIRLCAGAVMLAAIVRMQSKSWAAFRKRELAAPLALFAYAAPFSFAYVRIGAAVGALVLFGVVQITMIGYGVIRGESTPPLAWLGAIVATGGLLNLTLPAVARPDVVGVLLMVVAGIAWGVYSLIGRTVADPVAANARSFLWSSVLAVVLLLAAPVETFLQPRGVALAIISGAITSGLGYAIWYQAVRHLTAMQAAVAQMTVPVIAGVAAVLILREQLSARLLVSGAAVLGGVTLVLFVRTRKRVA